MIVLGCDHAGVTLKRRVIEHLKERGLPYLDVGINEGERGDYPVLAWKAAQVVLSGEADKGIIICGTGIGNSIAANKVKGIRCVVCSEPYSARMSREHNDSNMLSLGARVVGEELAVEIVNAWLDTGFDGGRHQRRVDQIHEIETDGRVKGHTLPGS
jgi:ribose 5-phosphate isomerase B